MMAIKIYFLFLKDLANMVLFFNIKAVNDLEKYLKFYLYSKIEQLNTDLYIQNIVGDNKK